MNLLTRLRFALAGLSLKAAGLSVVPEWTRQSFLDPSFDRLVSQGLKRNSVFFACVGALAFSFQEPPLIPYTQEGEDGEPWLDHPLRFLLRRPNALMGEREMWATTMTYMGVGGNAYWHKVRNGNGQVIRLNPYHEGQMEPVPGGDNWIARFDYDNGSGRKVPIPVEDVIHFRWPIPDPDQPWMGLPPLVAAAQEVDTDNEVKRYVYALLKNDAVPRTALELPETVGTPSDDEVKRIKAQWRQKYGGTNRGDVALITGGAKIHRVGTGLDELAYDALARIPESRITAVMRTPAILAGTNSGMERSTFANYAEARRAFTEDTLVPFWQMVASEIDRGLVPEFGDDRIDMRFDLSQVKSLSDNTDALWERTNKATAGGILKINEARTRLGLEEDPGGDVFVWQLDGFGGAPTQVIDVTPPKAQPKALPAPRERKATDARTAKRNARRLQRIRLRLIEEMADGIDDYYDDLADRVVNRARSQKAGDLPDLDQLLLNEDEERLQQLFEESYVELVRASWQTWGDMLDDETPFSLDNPAVQNILATSGDNIADITETTQGAIQRALVVGRENGWSIEQLVEGVDDLPGLRSVVEETYKDRARTIARTELGTAQNRASGDRYRSLGVTHVRVSDNGFSNSHERCKELDGTVQTLDWMNESSENMLQHPNCVRSFSPHFEE